MSARPRRRVVSIVTLAIASLVTAVVHAALPHQSGKVDLLTQANVQLDGAAASDFTGGAMASAGDVNGDGLADVIVGSGNPNGADGPDNNGREDSGSAYVVFGQPDRTSVDLADLGGAGFRIDGATAEDVAGNAVGGGDDVNGDGLDDVIVGAEHFNSDTGAAYVVFGKTSTTNVDLATFDGTQTTGFRIDGTDTIRSAGEGVDIVGDLNGDGLAEVMVNNPGEDNNGRIDSGSVYVIFGKSSTATVALASFDGMQTTGFRIDGAEGGDRIGTSLAAAGDVNGDGLPDILIGARNAPFANTSAGAAFVVFGKPSTSTIDLGTFDGSQTSGFRMSGATDDLVGDDIAGLGDFNGDGLDDILVGARLADQNNENSGAAYLVYGKASGATVDFAGFDGTQTTGFRIIGGAQGDRAGAAVAGPGDVNGDGRPDAIVGADGTDHNGRNLSGSAYVLFGNSSPANLNLDSFDGSQTNGFVVDGAAEIDNVGSSVAGPGDINGDSRPDIVIGAESANPASRADAGAAYALFGFGTPSFSYSGSVTGAVGTPIAALGPTVTARTGTPSFAVSPPLPAGLALDPSSGTIAGTPTQGQAATTHTVTMTDLAGTATVPLQVTVTGGPTPGGPTPGGPTPGGTAPDGTAPRATGFGVTTKRFAVDRAATAINARAKRGTTFRYTLSEVATSRITISRSLPGRRSGRRCVKPTRSNRRAKRCTRLVRAGTLTRKSQPAGRNDVKFTGRIGRRALKLGPHQATLVATDAAGNTGRAVKVGFTIVRR